MTKDKALDLALEALEELNNTNSHWWQEVDETTIAKIDPTITAIKQALATQPVPVQDLPFGVGGGLVAIKTLLGRDPCVHANTAIGMIDAILKEHPAAQPAPVQSCYCPNCEAMGKELAALKAQPAPVQEPVAWMYEDMMGVVGVRVQKEKPIVARPVTPLCLCTPPAAQPATWVGLSEEEILKLAYPIRWQEVDDFEADKAVNFSHMIEAKLREKNGGAA
jgi:hypothetical protein